MICGYCTRDIRNPGSNRTTMHDGCLRLAIEQARSRGDTAKVRLLSDRMRRREEEPRQKSTPSRPAGPLCDFCGRTHPDPREAHECALRASRAAADVAARRRW